MTEPATSFKSSTPMGRPKLHLTAEEGWINDPLGLTYHDGLYHLFFQYVPKQVTWDPRCHWGHAVSTDLLTWTERKVVLEPGDGDGGCWSGSIVVNGEGRATMFYTSVQLDDLSVGQVRVAHPTDETWDRWQKGPVIAAIAPHSDTAVFRDPHVSHHGDHWRMILGAGRTDGTATALSYRSTNLTHWTADGEFASRPGSERNPLWTGTVWECPQLIAFGDKYTLLFSVWEPWTPYYEAYAVGQMVAGEFVAETWGRLSYGDAYYAGATFIDDAGQPGLIYWLRGIDDIEGRWAGANSLPHRLRLEDNVLIAEPHPNLARRRGRAVRIGDEGGPTDAMLPPLADVEWLPQPHHQAAELIVSSANGTSVLRIATVEGELQLEVGAQRWTMPSDSPVRIIIDGPVVEAFTSAGTFSAPLEVTGAETISVTHGVCLIYRL